MVILLYVDDMIIIGNYQKPTNDLKGFLASCFKLQQLNYFIGIEISHSKKGIIINQCKYTLDIPKKNRIT